MAEKKKVVKKERLECKCGKGRGLRIHIQIPLILSAVGGVVKEAFKHAERNVLSGGASKIELVIVGGKDEDARLSAAKTFRGLIAPCYFGKKVFLSFCRGDKRYMVEQSLAYSVGLAAAVLKEGKCLSGAHWLLKAMGAEKWDGAALSKVIEEAGKLEEHAMIKCRRRLGIKKEEFLFVEIYPCSCPQEKK